MVLSSWLFSEEFFSLMENNIFNITCSLGYIRIYVNAQCGEKVDFFIQIEYAVVHEFKKKERKTYLRKLFNALPAHFPKTVLRQFF